MAEDLTLPVLSLDLKKSCGHDSEKTGRTSHTLILARASAIPVLSGLPLDAIARYAGQPAVLDAQCGVLAINPNDAVSGYYRWRRRWRINAKTTGASRRAAGLFP